jgi:hypothetical protein
VGVAVEVVGGAVVLRRRRVCVAGGVLHVAQSNTTLLAGETYTYDFANLWPVIVHATLGHIAATQMVVA